MHPGKLLFKVASALRGEAVRLAAVIGAFSRANPAALD
jgi:hypothetical protein